MPYQARPFRLPQGDDEREAESDTEDDVTRSVLAFTVDFRDNEKVFKCESTNPALEEPHTTNVTLLVYCEQRTEHAGQGCAQNSLMQTGTEALGGGKISVDAQTTPCASRHWLPG